MFADRDSLWIVKYLNKINQKSRKSIPYPLYNELGSKSRSESILPLRLWQNETTEKTNVPMEEKRVVE